MPKPDYYEILGVAADADAQAIRRAFRRLAKQWHPDRNRDDPEAAEERFRQILDAWRALGDPARRRRYDWETGRPPRPRADEPPAPEAPAVADEWPASDADLAEVERGEALGRLASDREATCGCLLLLIALSSPGWGWILVKVVNHIYEVIVRGYAE